MSRTKGLEKRMVFSLSTVLLCIALIEVCAFLGYWIARDDVDLWRGWRESVNEQDYQRFLELAYDPTTGWNNQRDRVVKKMNCLDQEWTATYDGKGARVHSSDRDDPIQILVVGDSFAHGSEVNDHETFPAQLERLGGVRVANHGVGGFGPTQSLVNLRRLLEYYREVKVVIFSVMHENIVRMVTSFRPANNPSTGIRFGFKPFVMNGTLRENPNAPPAITMAELERLARKAFREDFWSRGEWSFPYLLSWKNFALSDYFYFKVTRKLAKLSGDSKTGYNAYYESDSLRGDLVFVIESFYDLAQRAKVRPIVLFIPRKPGDLTSAQAVLEDLHARFGSSDMAILDLSQTDLDWNAFNLEPGHCHPSPYGHKMIAETVMQHLDF